MTTLFKRAAMQIFPGSKWQEHAGERLKINERTIRRWCNGTMPVPEGIYAELALLLAFRIATLQTLHRELREAALNLSDLPDRNQAALDAPGPRVKPGGCVPGEGK